LRLGIGVELRLGQIIEPNIKIKILNHAPWLYDPDYYN